MTDIVTLTMNPAVDVSTSAERVVSEHKLRCSQPLRDPGGGGINVARVATRLGADVKALYPRGGETGALLHRLIDAEGIASLAVHVAGETREDITVYEEESGEQFRFVFPGPELGEDEWGECLAAISSLKGRPAWFVASGSLPPGVPEDFYARAARAAKACGAHVIVDTSGPALERALDAGVFLVKPNLRELRQMTGETLDDQESRIAAARQLVDAGRTEIVALSLGHDGALFVTAEGAWRAPALDVKLVSAVGAGDSFVGGLTWSLAVGHDLPDAFRHAVAAGSAALLTPGTELSRAEDVRRLYKDVALERL
ncbi:MAG: 1-phosphofructokinase family hexose kinase [Hyphomicrobiales bacterium]